MAQSVILRLKNVTKHFSRSSDAAVADLTLSLNQGDLLTLLGPSGCGKTTLLRLIAGFEQPETGTIELAGQPVAGNGNWVPPERRDVGMVFQDYALFPHLSVMDNVSFGLKHQPRPRSHQYTPAEIKKLTAEAIALVGLEGLDQRYPHELSGGQQQRVALARALAPRPALVLLDEPLSNLDAQIRVKLRQEIRDILKAAKTSAVFVTHDQEEALSISDWVAVMRQGKLEQWGTPEAIYQTPASRFVAEFVTQANFLPAKWNGHGWETAIGYFASSRVNTPVQSGVGNSSSQSAASGNLMIRPEALMLEPDEAGVVVVRDRQFLGREHRYALSGPFGQELYARLTTGTPLAIGTRVKLSVAESALQVFPEHS